VKIRSFVHKSLKKLYLEDSAKGLPPDAVDKLRAMLTFLQDMQDPEALRVFPALESASAHRGPQGRLEPACLAQLAADLPYRGRRDRGRGL
jgi:plasmid maintenance system killer protein